MSWSSSKLEWWAFGPTLQFADLPYANIIKLPNSISRLYNLHTLMPKHCPNLVNFPDGIGNMVSLRHLDIRWSHQNIEWYLMLVSKMGLVEKLCNLNLVKVKNLAPAVTANLSANRNLTTATSSPVGVNVDAWSWGYDWEGPLSLLFKEDRAWKSQHFFYLFFIH